MSSMVGAIVVPYGIDFITWTCTLYDSLPQLNLPMATTEDEWKDWAESMILDNDLVNVPLPESFDSWQNWAEYFLNNV